jgi:hypothetical protein
LVGILTAFLLTVVVSTAGATASRVRKPHRIGPIVAVMSGANWSVVAWRSDHGLCYSYGAPGAEGDGCGISLRKTIDVLEIGPAPSLVFRRNGALAIGVVSAAVAEVTLRVSRRQTVARIYKGAVSAENPLALLRRRGPTASTSPGSSPSPSMDVSRL